MNSFKEKTGCSFNGENNFTTYVAFVVAVLPTNEPQHISQVS